MSDKKILGYSSLVLFVVAILIVLFIAAQLVFFPTALPFVSSNGQMLIITSCVLALVAGLLGLISRQTPQGKVGGIGGMVLFLALVVFLSFTLVTRVETTGVVPQPVVEFIEAGN